MLSKSHGHFPTVLKTRLSVPSEKNILHLYGRFTSCKKNVRNLTISQTMFHLVTLAEVLDN
jgi:hypothetical protein